MVQNVTRKVCGQARCFNSAARGTTPKVTSNSDQVTLRAHSCALASPIAP